MLPSIIHYDQNAFVKGRNIFDAVRTINDIFDFTKIKTYDAILTAIDFEKAFDSLHLNFLFHLKRLVLVNLLLHGLGLFIRIYQVVSLTMVSPHLFSNLNEVSARVTLCHHIFS